jgi:(2R)-ethylmalonyl-CoA mutase
MKIPTDKKTVLKKTPIYKNVHIDLTGFLTESEAQIAASARDEDPDVIGLSILSGSHLQLVPDVLHELQKLGVDAPVILGGIIPEDDRDSLRAIGIAAVYTPKDFDIARIMREIAEIVRARRG